MEAQNLPTMSMRLPWKHIGIAALVLLSALFFLYIFTVRKTRQLKGRVAGLDDENQTLKHLVEAANQSLQDVKAEGGNNTIQLPEGYEMPVIRPGLMFNIQPEVNFSEPAFNAWNTGGTLRVFAVLDIAGRLSENQVPAWAFQLFSAGGALLRESNIPIEGAKPDGKRITAEIRSLLEADLTAESE